MADCKNGQNSFITAEEWRLVNHSILLLEPFFVTKEFSINNTLLSSMIPHAISLTKFVNFKNSKKYL